MALSKSEISKLEDARTVGGEPSVTLTSGEMVNLLKLVAQDLGFEIAQELSCDKCRKKLNSGFFAIDVSSLHCEQLDWVSTKEGPLYNTLSEVAEDMPDVLTYYSNLVQLHSYRRKFEAVSQFQDIPSLEEIIPQGLLELGKFNEGSIVSWMIWRKFMYNLDNRSAQLTGYLFEPILTESIGGASYSASTSPIEKVGRKGSRQVDCIVDEYAYEFKKRMTIAASGQGRFGEELNFAEDAASSGYTPILLVLDPTPSAKLDKLSDEFRQYGGNAFVGDEAWEHLESKAGAVMSAFLEKYVRKPLSRIDQYEETFAEISLEYSRADDSVTVVVGGDDEIKLR